ncbi:MAG: aminotransferase class V-fold PLP-dependent enzyme [Chloroflexota bacterium]
MQTLADQYLLDPEIIFLNHGSFGATPRPVFTCFQNWQLEMERQPVEFLGRRFNHLMRSVRDKLAEYLGTQADNLVYMANTTTGMNTIARSLNLHPGDEVLATDHEYGAIDRMWRFLAQKRGFQYLHQPIPLPLATHEDFLQALWAGVTERTRVISISHITSPTALIFPVEKVCDRARQQGILTIIDGAHAPGQIPLNLEAIGADFYVGNLHKWLSAPKSGGFLFARPQVQGLLEPLVVSWGWESDIPGPSPFIDYFEWQGTRDIAAFLAVPEAIRFQKENNWDAVRADCHALVVECQQRIVDLTGLPSLYTDAEIWVAQMASNLLPPLDIEALTTRLYQDCHIEVPVFMWKDQVLIRVCINAYNRPQDIDTLVNALRSLLPDGKGLGV